MVLLRTSLAIRIIGRLKDIYPSKWWTYFRIHPLDETKHLFYPYLAENRMLHQNLHKNQEVVENHKIGPVFVTGATLQMSDGLSD